MDLLYTAHVPPGDGPHPTLILLHGWGASAHDLLGLAPILLDGRALVLCPQGSLAFDIGGGVPGYGWFPLYEGRAPDLGEIEQARARVEAFVDAAVARYPVDRRHLVIGGFSQGGFMAYQLALNAPERFAGLLALSSWLPAELAETIERKPALAELSTLVIHGSADPMIDVERARQSRDALVRLGVPTVYREYEMGHEISPQALREMREWLESKVVSPIQLI